MQCEAFERRLQQLLDDRQPPEYDRQLRQHAEVCSDCAETLAAQELLFDRLRSDWIDEPDDEFAAIAVQQASILLSSSASGSPSASLTSTASGGMKLLLTAAIAALLLLIVVPAWVGRTPRGTYTDASQSAIGESIAGLPALSQPASGAQDAAGRTVNGDSGYPPVAGPLSVGSDGRVELLQMDSLAHALYIDSFGTLLLELPDGTLAPVDQLTGGLRPLASSFSVAFDALRRSFPLGWESRGEKRRAATTPVRGEFV